jgi:hypothetical protein
MILPNYKEIITRETDRQTFRKIIFDKIWVKIYGNAKYSYTELKIYINSGCRRRNVDLSTYINSINDYLVSHPCYKKYKDKVVNLFDLNCIRSLEFKGLKFNSNEFQIIKNKYPNLYSIGTDNCTIYKEASIGCLGCDYYDNNSYVMSLDSFDLFSGNKIELCQTHILNMNENVLHLNNVCTNFNRVDIDYERFFLTTDAPNMRKIIINGNNILNDKDLLFISGFYNLESVEARAILSNYEQLEKLERLRRIDGVRIFNEKALENARKKRERVYQIISDSNESEERKKCYLMTQRMIIQNEYQELRHKLYIERLERVKWDDKISRNDLEQIKKELEEISNMPREKRRDISREKQNHTLFDSMNALEFDRHENDEKYVLTNSHLFDIDDGIDCYVNQNKIIL